MDEQPMSQFLWFLLVAAVYFGLTSTFALGQPLF